MTAPKIAGLERLQAARLNVPAFTTIPDLRLSPGGHNRKTVRDSIAQALQVLGYTEAGYSIRSAASDEDTHASSAAGKYRSFNALRNIDALERAASLIWAQHREVSTAGSQCSLVIQTTLATYLGGVAFSDERTKSIVVEMSYGSTRSVVEGTGGVFRARLTEGHWELEVPARACERFYAHAALFNPHPVGYPGDRLAPRHAPFPEHVRLYQRRLSAEWVVYGYPTTELPAWYEDVLGEIVEALGTVSYPGGTDLEWGCASQGVLSFFQARPVTQPLPIESSDKALPRRANEVYGTPCSGGIASGVVSRSEDVEGMSTIRLVLPSEPIDLTILRRSSGVLLVAGGLLAHVATACREIGKPCVAGVGSSVRPGDLVHVDGDTGVVTIGGTQSGDRD